MVRCNPLLPYSKTPLGIVGNMTLVIFSMLVMSSANPFSTRPFYLGVAEFTGSRLFSATARPSMDDQSLYVVVKSFHDDTSVGFNLRYDEEVGSSGGNHHTLLKLERGNSEANSLSRMLNRFIFTDSNEEPFFTLNLGRDVLTLRAGDASLELHPYHCQDMTVRHPCINDMPN